MRRDNSSTGDFDLYARSGTTIAAVGGLGRNGRFHYWTTGGVFVNTAVGWSTNTWYLVTLVYNANTDRYDFVVYDQTLNEIVRQNNIAFGNLVPTINVSLLNTSGTFVGNGFGDDFRLRKYVSPEPTTSVRSYSDIQERVQVAGTGPLTFNYTGIGMDVTTQGSLSYVQIIRYNHFHPNSPAAQQPVVRRYWEIIPNGGASGYTASLTLPHPRVPDNGDTVCFYVSGTTWDCAADSVDNVAGTITRAGIPQFSEWTTQEDFSPLAITLQNFEASSKTRLFIPGLLAASLACALTAAVLLWSRRVRPYR